MSWFIYSLIDPRNHRVRYVGKTNDVRLRLRKHIELALRSQRRNHRFNWIRSLVDAGQLPTLAIIESGEGAWQAAEKHWIAFYRMAGCALVNATDGGDGAENPSAETRARMSASHKGHIHTAEQSAKIGAAHRALWKNPEYRVKMSAIHKGRVRSAETCARISAALKGRHFSPERCAVMSAARKGHVPSAETRAKLSAAQKARWVSPEARTKLGAAVKTALSSPEVRAKLSTTIKAAWARRRAKTNEVSP